MKRQTMLLIAVLMIVGGMLVSLSQANAQTQDQLTYLPLLIKPPWQPYLECDNLGGTRWVSCDWSKIDQYDEYSLEMSTTTPDNWVAVTRGSCGNCQDVYLTDYNPVRFRALGTAADGTTSAYSNIVSLDPFWDPFNGFSFNGSQNGGQLEVSIASRPYWTKIWVFEYYDTQISMPTGWNWDPMNNMWVKIFSPNSQIKFTLNWSGDGVGIMGSQFESQTAISRLRQSPNTFGADIFPQGSWWSVEK